MQYHVSDIMTSFLIIFVNPILKTYNITQEGVLPYPALMITADALSDYMTNLGFS